MDVLTPPSSSPPSSSPLAQWSARRRRRTGRERVAIAGQLGFAAAAIAISFQIDNGIFIAVIGLFVLVVPFEKMYPRKKGQRLRRPMLSTDISFALMGPILNVVGLIAVGVIGIASLFWLPGLALRPLVSQIPAPVLPFVALVMFDFLAYWAHRWAHEVPFLWRFHAVHHSPEHMDWISGFRVHPFDGVLVAPGAFFLIGAGVDAEVTGVLVVLQIVLGIFFHANVRVRWRWLDKILANPEFHHWHHANESDSIGHNYAPALPIWDMLFGTFFMPARASDRRPTHYGLDEYMPRHLIGMLSYPLRGARRHISLLWHPIRAVKIAVGGARKLAGDIFRSTSRATHSVRRTTTVGCSTTNDSLFGSLAEPPGIDPNAIDGSSDLDWQRELASSGVYEF